ncbi:MAG: Fe-S oxidoreductase [Labilithrix sp.]|nr:Fe-S oxidoreductase [Labilithrix sp.]
MKILGKSSSVASVIGAAIGLAVTCGAAPASAQIAPTGVTNTQPAPKSGGPSAGSNPAAPATPAKPVDPKALLASGEKKFKSGDFSGALADFQTSNTAKASPEADRWIGQAQDNLGHMSEAVAAYERFLANTPPTMKAQADETRKRIEAIKAMPGKVHVETTPAGAQIVIDPQPNAPVTAGANSATPPTPTDVELAPGKHVIRLSADGYTSVDKEVEVAYGTKQDLKVDLAKSETAPPPSPPVTAENPAPTPPPPAPPPEPRSKVPAFVTGAVAIVAAGVGTGFGIAALGQSSDFKKDPTTKRADDGENNALVADMMFGIAITFGVTSAVLFLSGDAPQTAKADPQTRVAKAPKITITPTPYVTPSGGGAGAVVRF